MFPYLNKLVGRKLSMRAGAWLAAGVLALLGLAEVGARELHQVMARTRARHALPKVREETTRELRALVRAIDQYKNRLGSYPPDHVVSRNPLVVDAITNQLLYELQGTVRDASNDVFVPSHFPPIRRTDAKEFFNVASFRNCTEPPASAKSFLTVSDIPGTLGVQEKPEVGLLAFAPNWEGIDAETLAEIPIASWRYNSSAPVHNPASYDLWIEVPVMGTNVVVGNW